MSFLEGWDLDQYRIALRQRAETLKIDPRVQVRFDESDLVQETLMKALKADQAACTGSTHGERIAWLFAIQENLLRDKYDEQFAKKRDPRREVDVAAMQRAFVDSTADFISQGQAAGPSPSEDAAQREEHEILAKLLAQLPEEYRKVLLLRQEGLTVTEIAGQLGVTDGVIAGRIARATSAWQRSARLSERGTAMAESDSEHPDGDPRVAEAVLAFLRAQDQGTPLDVEAWVTSYPEEIRAELREIAEGLDLLGHRPAAGCHADP